MDDKDSPSPVFMHTKLKRKWFHKWSHSCSVTSLNHLVGLQSCEKATGWCTAQWEMLLFCVKTIKKTFGRLANFCFGTFTMHFHATWHVVGHENTQRWMVHCHIGYCFEKLLYYCSLYWVSALSLRIESTDSMIHTNASSVSDCHCQVYLLCYALQLGSTTSPPSCEILVNCGLYGQVTLNPILSLAGLVILNCVAGSGVSNIHIHVQVPEKSEKDLK